MHDILQRRSFANLYAGKPFDSIAVSYLLHCLPGPVCNKAILFENLAPLLPTLASSSEAPFSARRWTIIGWTDKSCGV